MKKMNVILFAVAAMVCAVAFGGPNYGSESKVAVLKNGDVFKVIYQGPAESIVNVTILDADEQPVFKEKIISHGNFIRPYNLSQLPKGDYKICVDDQAGKRFEKLCSTDIEANGTTNEEQVTDLDEKEWTTHKDEWNAHIAKLKGAENKFMISIPHQGNDNIAINIYDQNQQLVFSEHQKIEKDFAKVYVLKGLNGASFRVINQTSKKVKRYPAD